MQKINDGLKNKVSLKRAFFLIALFIFLILLDQLSKAYAIKNLNFICNGGVSFGLKINAVLFLVFWLILIAALMFLFIKTRGIDFLLIFALSGAASNVIDRISKGCVIDFIRLPIAGLPLFNAADTLLFISIAYLVFVSIKIQPGSKCKSC